MVVPAWRRMSCIAALLQVRVGAEGLSQCGREEAWAGCKVKSSCLVVTVGPAYQLLLSWLLGVAQGCWNSACPSVTPLAQPDLPD